jgi:hypothetical protein
MTARHAHGYFSPLLTGLLVLILCSSLVSAAGNISGTFSPDTNSRDFSPSSPATGSPGPGLPEDPSPATDPVTTDLNTTLPDNLQTGVQSFSKTFTLISGHVFRGSGGGRNEVLEGVPVELFCLSTPDDPGAAVLVTRTDSSGRYEILVEDTCRYYIIAAFPPGIVIRAESEKGTIIEGNRIRFTAPLTNEVIVENNFWAEYPKPGDAPLLWDSGGLVVLWMGMFVAGFIIIILWLGILSKKGDEKQKK